jgi:hypothetical protein
LEFVHGAAISLCERDVLKPQFFLRADTEERDAQVLC